MAHVQRKTVYGRIPPCGGQARVEEHRNRAQMILNERNRKQEKSEEFVCYDDSEDEEEVRNVENVSFNFVDLVLAREQGSARLEPLAVSAEHGTRHMLTHGMFKENAVTLNNMNKIFCSKWLSDRQVVFGTKCSKLMVLDVVTRQLDQIPSLQSPGENNPPEQQCGIHAVEINPSRTLIATGAKNSNEIAVYKLPTLDPVCVGENAHRDWVFDICWLDDQFFVSGSRDTSMALWRIQDSDFPEDSETSTPSYKHVKPLAVKTCKSAEKVRSLAFNPHYEEIVALSLNGYIHVWNAESFRQKLSRKLSYCLENVCLAMQDDCTIYAVGSKSHTTLLDSRTLQPIRKIPSRYNGCGIRSTSFNGAVLTIGTGVGVLLFYDLRAGKYMESNMTSGRAVVLKATKGWVFPDEDFIDVIQHIKYTPAVYTHCYDSSGTRLFAAGGPLPISLYGNYLGLWQ